MKKGYVPSLFIVSLFLLVLSISSCEKPKKPGIYGVWAVEKVTMGDQEVTPVDRWMQFNEDGTQISGNGWYPHSRGTFSLKDSILSTETSNGLKDPAGPFTVRPMDSTMTFHRTEEGMPLTVYLRKISQYPTSGRDHIIGAWETDSSETVFFRWDRVYKWTYPDGHVEFGIYKYHSHKSEIECVPYHEPEFHRFTIDGNHDQMQLNSLEDQSVKSFKRTFELN